MCICRRWKSRDAESIVDWHKESFGKKAEEKGDDDRPRMELSEYLAENVKECLKKCHPLEAYRQQTNLKKPTLYKYVSMIKKEIKYLHYHRKSCPKHREIRCIRQLLS